MVMSYRQSKIDTANFNWFKSKDSFASLKTIRLVVGTIRGLSPFKIEFSYPISVFAGENGAGKSTILALSACAFHNHKFGYKLVDRKKTYYTFSDFFIQSTEEVPLEGIKICYEFLHNKWRGSKAGLGWQCRTKKRGGKWSKYKDRVKRSVVFFGIQRVVPYYERSASRSYKYQFAPTKTSVDRNKRICDIAGKILGKNYCSYDLHQCGKYFLPHVKVNNNHQAFSYSGYNMGAGESSVFNILTTLFEAGKGAMLVIDEIELALHEKAQKSLMKELKKLCQEFSCQIICSTHSPTILDSVPPEGRFYIEAYPKSTVITPGISTLYAAGKLSGDKSGELDIYLEDEVAKSITRSILPQETRERVNIKPMGSHEAVIRHLAERYKEGDQRECMAVLDGDQRSTDQSHKGNFKKYLESINDKDEANAWINERLVYLPGEQWPERWLIEAAKGLLSDGHAELSDRWGVKPDVLNRIFFDGLNADKHNEFFVISKSLHLDISQVINDIAQFVYQYKSMEFENIRKTIENLLKES
jgi:predicted ATPase